MAEQMSARIYRQMMNSQTTPAKSKQFLPEQTATEIFALYRLSYKSEDLDGFEPPTSSLLVK